MLENKISVLLTESPEYDCPNLKKILENMPEFRITGSVKNAREAVAMVQSYSPQLVFVQEELFDMSGIEFVKSMYRRNLFPEIVFIARDYNFAFDSLELAPLDYLKMPLSAKAIEDMVERLKFKMKRDELRRKMDVYVRSHEVDLKRVFIQKKGIVILQLSEIVFCRAELTKSILILTDGEQVPLKTGLNETVEIINSSNFFRLSRSYCINRDYLRKIDKKNSKCLMLYQDLSWEIPASRGVINRLETLYTLPTY